MPKSKRIVVNCKTGEITTEEFDTPKSEPLPPKPYALNIEKLVNVLINEGLINSREDLE